MARKIKCTAIVKLDDPKNPSLQMTSKRGFQQDLMEFRNGQKVWVMVEPFYKQRSQNQNGVLHWYCTELADYLGMEMEDFKMMMKLKFLQRPKLDREGNEIVDPETGEIMMYIPSTKDLTTVEINDFIFEGIRKWALDFLNYELALPDTNYKIHFLEDEKLKKTNNDKKI